MQTEQLRDGKHYLAKHAIMNPHQHILYKLLYIFQKKLWNNGARMS
jgi:hypothetical protein